MAKVLKVIWGEREAEYFYQKGWTGMARKRGGDLPVGQTPCRHCEERSDEAIHFRVVPHLDATSLEGMMAKQTIAYLEQRYPSLENEIR
jgi:hypothetical protein